MPEYLRRISARLTTQALEVRKGVFFRSEATIPLNRITDVRLHDGPLMRHYGLRGLKVETAGQSGDTGSEGNIISVIDAVGFRNAVLRQRQEALGSEQGAGSRNTAAGAAELLTEIRDILARIESRRPGPGPRLQLESHVETARPSTCRTPNTRPTIDACSPQGESQ